MIKANRLAQGYIFFGEPQVGKLTFAKNVANFLENGEFEISKRVLSDCFIFNEKGSGTGINTIRSLKMFSSQKPIISPRKTIVIDEVELPGWRDVTPFLFNDPYYKIQGRTVTVSQT